MTDEDRACYDKFLKVADEASVPEHLTPGLALYYLFGIQPGSFLCCVLCNDLKGAIAYGDSISLAGLPRLVKFIYNRLPGICWGDDERFSAWMNGKAKTEGAVALLRYMSLTP